MYIVYVPHKSMYAIYAHDHTDVHVCTKGSSNTKPQSVNWPIPVSEADALSRTLGFAKDEGVSGFSYARWEYIT